MRSPGSPSRNSSRFLSALALANLGGWLAGLLRWGGVTEHPAPPHLVLSVATLGSVLAALVRGRSSYTRALYVVPFAIYCATLTFSTSAYAERRGRIWNAELLLPSVISMAPFSVAYYAVNRHAEVADRRRRRDDLDT